MKTELNKFIKGVAVISVIIAILIASIITAKNSKRIITTDPELLRTISYGEFEEGSENVDGTDNVKFSAFFLRDLDGDGYAEKLKGTCREVGTDDTLYMELNVLTAGYLKNGKIEINGENFYFASSLPKDQQLKDNYIGTNIKKIELNDISNGTQKMIIGMVRSGDYSYGSTKIAAIGNNINNYSRNDNKITLTGTYVDEENNETEIRKEINLNMDWYGTTKATITNLNQKLEDLPDRIDEENETLNLSFSINANEKANKLLLSKNYIEGTIPELNGYKPTSVTTTASGVEFTYDEGTGKFTITREAEVDEQGSIIKNAYTNTSTSSKSNQYTINVTYPLDAYRAIDDHTVTISIPVQTYYEGYNNQNNEFTNPYKSNIARETIVTNFEEPSGEGRFEITVGKYVTNPTKRYIVSKEKPQKIYNGKSQEENNDLYTVKWYGYTGIAGTSSGMVMKETANGGEEVVDKFIKIDSTQDTMENVTTNVGIGFSRADSLLGTDGWIKVYDEETNNLLVTFTSNGANGTEKWGRYTETNPYNYEVPIKHIRIETSSTNAESSIYVYNIKKLNDEYITGNYTKEEFDNLSYIQSQVVGYIGDRYVNTDVNQAKYEAPYSIAQIKVSKSALSTQETEENEIITIIADSEGNYNQENWYNGSFLIKMPDEILETKINNISINNTNVETLSYELIENENGRFIKINTTNKVESEQSYVISIDCNLTPDPRISTMTRKLELYATNEAVEDYYYNSADIYDVNDNLNTEEKVNKTETSINLVSPNSLLTNQTMEINNDGNISSEIVVSPQILELRPLYEGEEEDKQEVKIGVQIKNNYSNTISEVKILGKIPFEGNKYVLSQGDLGSEFSTTMKSSGIEVPEELVNNVTIYYTENGNPTKEIQEESNGWKLAEDVTDWTKIKSYIIDLGNTTINQGKEYIFYYIVEVPNGVDLNKKAYSHHGVYFSLDTEEGKYRTQTEPNKTGVSISERYKLRITKYQKGKEKNIQGATYKVSRLDENGEIEETSTATTNTNGSLEMTNLYAEKVYTIQEIKTPEEYELNSEIIKFIGHVDEDGVLTVEKIEGTTKGNIEVTKQTGEDYKVNVSVEDEVKANIKIIKTDKETNEPIRNVRYKVTGEGLPENGKTITTNINGEANLKGLKIGEEYTLEEVKAEGYYINEEEIKFTIQNNNGTYNINVTETESLKEATITENENIPTINIEVTDEKIPTYNLKITKIKQLTQVEEGQEGNQQEEIEYLSGAKFKLYKEGKEIGTYITDENGNLLIENLYQYKADKNLNQTYVLKEVISPEGYSKVKDIEFYAEQITETQMQTIIDETTGEEREEEVTITRTELKQELEEGEKERNWTIEGNTINIIVEDIPSFKLIKKDSETGELLSGVKFAIYEANGNMPAKNSKGEFVGTKEEIDGKEYYVVTTNINGEITVDLQEGFYKAVEVKADEKYDLRENTYYFGIGASREGKVKPVVEWAESIDGTEKDYITSVSGTGDDGYVAGGYFKSSSIKVGEYTFTNYENTTYPNYTDGIIIKYGSEGEIEWAESVGGAKDDKIVSISRVQDGGFIAVGYFNSSITVGDYTLTNHGNYDGMIIKYSLNGEKEIVESIGGTGSEKITSVSGTEDGGYIIGGSFNSRSITVGNYTLTRKGNVDGMIIKYNPNGEVEWAESIGGTADDQITSVTETKDGGYIAGGYFKSSSITAGEYILTNNGSNTTDGMMIKYNSIGEIEWVESIGGTADDQITSVTETKDGGYIVGGDFKSSSITAGDYILTNQGNRDGMIIKYSITGEIEWAESIGKTSKSITIGSVLGTEDGGYIVAYNTEYDKQQTIKYSSAGDVEWTFEVSQRDNRNCVSSISETKNGEYIVGGYYTTYDIFVGEYILPGDINQLMSYTNGMIIKLKEKKRPQIVAKNAEVIGGTYGDQISSVSGTADGGYIAGGYFTNSGITVGDNTLTNHGNSDGMIIKYSREGDVERAESIGGSERDRITSVSGTADGGYIAVGFFYSSSITAGEYILTNNVSNASDGMMIKYNSIGEIEWAESIGGRYDDQISSVSGTADGGCIVGGYFHSSSITVGDYTLTNHGSSDGMIIKYTQEGEVEWAESIGGEKVDRITTVSGTTDGGYIVGGEFGSSSLTVGNYTLTNYLGSTDGMIIKYSQDGEVEWAESIGGKKGDRITTVSETTDGGYAVGVDFDSDSITIGDYTFVRSIRSLVSPYNDGVLIKYSSNGKVEWAKHIGGDDDDAINSVSATADGGVIVGGGFLHDVITVGEEMLTKHNNNNYGSGMLLKYSREGEIEWAEAIEGTDHNTIASVIETEDGDYIAGGRFYSSITIGDYTLTNHDESNSDGMLIKIRPEIGAQELQELEIENKRKEYKIKTDINEIDNIKGGTISGENMKPYELVKYGDSNTKEIKMIPDQDYEIIGITVNGEDWPFETEQDGSYTMPTFENMQEDKHIIVTYSMKDNKITINKKDSVSGETIEGTEFKLDQIEERPEPVNSDIIGNLIDNGNIYVLADYDKEVAGFIDLTTDLKYVEGVNYYFVPKTNIDGTTSYVPTNSKTWQTENIEGATAGIQSSTANSYIELDLSEMTGTYKVVVNGYVSSENPDYGYATITTNVNSITEVSSIPGYNNTTSPNSRFIYISGNTTTTKTAQDRESTIVLEGGQKYYLHLGYRKDRSADTGEDQFVINSVKLYETRNAQYNFATEDGKYISTNQGINNTTCNSYIPIDLEENTGKYNITVNAEVSTESGDYGYVTLNTTESPAPEYNSNTTTNRRFVYISGTESAQDYTIEVDGGYKYYLHLGYYKDTNTNTTGDDVFTVNSVSVSLSDSEIYHATITTNSSGQAITQIPFGKYKITETKAVDGYVPKTTPIIKDGEGNIISEEGIIEFRSTEGNLHEFTIENEKYGHVTVHHYIKGTTTSLAEDEHLTGEQGEEYITTPNVNISKYELEKDNEGKEILPDNKDGIYTHEDQEVIYYYVPKQVTVTVHHYIEDTVLPVPLANGNKAEDTILTGYEGNEYTSEAINETVLSENYELVKVPENANGVFNDEPIEVIYYYRLKETSVLVHHYKEGTETKLSEDVLIEGRISDTYSTTVAEDIPSKYELVAEPANKDGEMTLNQIIVTYYYRLKSTTVLVHHYEYGTTRSLRNDVLIEGTTDDPYTTEVASDLLENYDLVEEPNNKNGIMTENQIEVYYYYRAKPTSVLVHHYYDGTETKLSEDVLIEGRVYDNYTTRVAEDIPSKYELVAEPENKNGQMTKEQIEVTYYYRLKPTSVLVHHYIEGTESLVSEDVLINGRVDEPYTTTVAEEILDKYELVEEPSNKNGIMTEEQTVVTYYYRRITGNLKINKVDKDTREPIEGIEFGIYKGDYGAIELPEAEKVGNVYEKQIADLGQEVEYNFEIQPWDSMGVRIVNDNGKYIPTNTQSYINENGGSLSNYADSYFVVDLSSKSGKYAIVINAEARNLASDNCFYGWIGTSLQLSSGQFFVKNNEEATDYQLVVEGGNIYYLCLEYFRDTNISTEDYAAINSIKMYEAENVRTEIVNEVPTYTKTVINSIGETVDVIGEIEQPEMANSAGFKSYYKEDNRYIPMSSQKYINEHSGENNNNISLAYFEIDLSNREGYYQVKVNAEKDGSNNDTFECMLSENNNLNGYYDIFNIQGIKEAQDYTEILEGGKKYYLFFGYTKYSDSSVIDSASINSIDVNYVNATVKETEIGFDKNEEGKYVSNNKGQNNTIAHSVIPIDLRAYEGNLDLTVNAEISSEEGNDQGWVVVTDIYNIYNTPNYMYNLIRISGEVEAQDYTLELEGGRMYYLHMIYMKNGGDWNPVGDDTFTINEIRVETKRYNTVTTDENGMAQITLPTNEYTIVELAPKEGYNPGEPQKVTLTKDGLEVTIENEKKKGTVIVHHYIEGTETPVPITGGGDPTEIKTDVIGETYTTSPRSDVIEGYELVSGEVENASGEYIEGTIEVTYYYKTIPASVLVHHYIENTTTKLAEDVIIEGIVGQEYETEEANVGTLYRLVEIPENSTGNMTREQIVVTYYYRLKEAEITTNIEKTATTKITEEDEEISYNITYTANIDKYVGNANIVITDILPYEIDETKSELNGGVYNSENKTIIWTENVENIDTYTAGEAKQISITKQIKVVYKNQDVTKDIENKVTGKVELPETEQTDTKETTAKTEQEYKVNIKASKIWDDNSNSAGKRPEEVTLQVLNGTEIVREQVVTTANSKVTIETVEVTEEEGGQTVTREEEREVTDTNIWEYVFENLPKYDDQGSEIEYTVNEKDINSIYYNKTEVSQLTEVEEQEASITNKYEASVTNKFEVPTDTIEITVNKKWEDNLNVAGKRPTSITLVVTGNNQVYQEVVSGNNKTDEGWEYTFTVPKYDNKGDEISYTIDELETNSYYEKTEVGTLEKVRKETSETTNNTNETTNTTNTTEGNTTNETTSNTTSENTTNTTNTVNGNTTPTNQETEEYEEDKYEGRIVNTFKVPEEKINIEVTKLWSDNNNEYGVRPNRIKIELTGTGRNSEGTEGVIVTRSYILTTENAVEDNTNSTTDPNNTTNISNTWKYTFENLSKYDSYGDVIEYTIDEKIVENNQYYYEKVVGGTTITNTFNELKEGTAIITKIDIENSEVLKGAKFNLQDEEGNILKVIKQEGKYEISTTSQETNLETDENGRILINKLPFGKYKLVEVKAPEGYIKTEEEKEFEIDINSYTVENSQVTNIAKEITVENERIKIKISKQDEEGNLLPGAVLQLLNEQGEIVKEWETTEEAYEISPIAKGRYTIHEKEAPEGYNIAADEEIEIEETKEEQTYTMTDTKIKSILEITKVDSLDHTKKLQGAKYKIEKIIKEGQEERIDRTFEAQYETTDVSGKITFRNLVYGTYRITEVKAPLGYNLSKEPIEVEVNKTTLGTAGKITLTLQDTKKTELPVTGGMGQNIIILVGMVVFGVGIYLKKRES